MLRGRQSVQIRVDRGGASRNTARMPNLTLKRVQSKAVPIALVVLALGLALAGGASREDQLGQPIVRGFAIVAVMIVVLARTKISWDRVRPALILLSTCALLCAIQLVPLPPAVWHALGGRDNFVVLSTEFKMREVWRPLSLVPDATMNALFSLIVPFATAIVVAGLTPNQLRRLVPWVIGFVVLSAGIGLLQLVGIEWTNPLQNALQGDSAGVFANRNHQALLLAIGLLLLPSWAIPRNWRMRWPRTIAAIGLLPLFVLMVFATGSRAGLVLAALALLFNAWICADAFAGIMDRSKKVNALFLGGGIAVFLSVAALVVSSSRNLALVRIGTTNGAEDFRFKAFPVVQNLIGKFFPWGSGMGSFDSVYRAVEPVSLLRPTYFNHAHNDFAEIVLEAGVPGAMLLIGAIVWIAFRAGAAQRSPDSRWARQARAGVGIIVLVAVASFVDYPARVPIYMALLVIASCWATVEAEREHWTQEPPA